MTWRELFNLIIISDSVFGIENCSLYSIRVFVKIDKNSTIPNDYYNDYVPVHIKSEFCYIKSFFLYYFLLFTAKVFCYFSKTCYCFVKKR